MTLVLLFALIQSQPTIDAVCQHGFKDASFTAKVVSGNQGALKRIGKDFGQSYKFSSARVFIAEPFKLRIESMYEDSKVVMVENALTTIYTIPGTGIRRVRDLSHSPGGRQTLMDFGVLTPSLFESLFDAHFVSEDATAGTVTYDLTYRKSPEYEDTSRHRIIVDRVRGIVVQRQWFGQDGKLRATFVYRAPIEVAGVWVPTDMVVTNADGQVAGETRAVDLKVNTGLDARLFAVR